MVLQSTSTSSEPMRVLVTGAASLIGYTLSSWVIAGHIFGAKQPIILHLLDIPEEAGRVDATAAELYDCAFPLLRNVVPTCDPVVAFNDISVAFLLGGVEVSTEDANTRDVMHRNALIFRDQARCLDVYARKDCRVLVTASFCHTMALIVSQYAPSIPKENITAFARLDLNCALNELAHRMNVPPTNIKNVCVWGNHSETTFTDVSHASVLMGNQYKRVVDVLNDDHYVRNQLIETVTARSKTTRRFAISLSAAKAAADQMRDWMSGTPSGQYVAMGVLSDGSYGVPKDLIFSFPVEVKNGKWIIAKGLKMDVFAKAKLDATVRELIIEKSDVFLELEKD